MRLCAEGGLADMVQRPDYDISDALTLPPIEYGWLLPDGAAYDNRSHGQHHTSSARLILRAMMFATGDESIYSLADRYGHLHALLRLGAVRVDDYHAHVHQLTGATLRLIQANVTEEWRTYWIEESHPRPRTVSIDRDALLMCDRPSDVWDLSNLVHCTPQSNRRRR
jgi:hypothetical protein